MPKGMPVMLGMIALAAVFVVVAVLYAVGTLQVLADSSHKNHYTHAVLFTVLAIVCLVGASFARPKTA